MMKIITRNIEIPRTSKRDTIVGYKIKNRNFQANAVYNYYYSVIGFNILIALDDLIYYKRPVSDKNRISKD